MPALLDHLTVLLHLYSKRQQVSQQLNHGMQMVTIGKISSWDLGPANSTCLTAACTDMAELLRCTRKRLVEHQHRAEDTFAFSLLQLCCCCCCCGPECTKPIVHPLIATVFHTKHASIHAGYGGLQVQMLFTTQGHYQHASDLEEEANLLFVRHYNAAPDQQLSKEQRQQDLTPTGLVTVSAPWQFWDSHAPV